MPRPRSPRSTLTSKRFYAHGNNDTALPPLLVDLLESEDPALASITQRVLAARMAGDNPSDPEVLGRCIREGRLAYLGGLLDGAA